MNIVRFTSHEARLASCEDSKPGKTFMVCFVLIEYKYILSYYLHSSF